MCKAPTAYADKPLYVLVVDRNSAVRNVLGELLNGHTHMHVIGQTASIGEAVLLARHETPDIVLLDGALFTMEVLARIRQTAPGVRFVAMLSVFQEDCQTEFLQRGASRCLIKRISLVEIIEIIHAACETEALGL